MGKLTLAEMQARALELTKANVQKGRTSKAGSYLGNFVQTLNGVGEEGAKTRLEVISEMSYNQCQEAFAADGGFNFENPEHVEAFAIANKKTKAMVAAAIE